MAAIKKQYFRARTGYTLIEAVVTLASLTILIVAILSVLVYLNRAAEIVKSNASIQSYVIDVTETISRDLNDGLDILAIDYTESPEITNKQVSGEITVYEQPDVFGKSLYMIEIDVIAKEQGVQDIIRVYLNNPENN